MNAVSLSVLIASFHPGDLVVNLMAQILGLGMSFLCGAEVPVTVLNVSVRQVRPKKTMGMPMRRISSKCSYVVVS